MNSTVTVEILDSINVSIVESTSIPSIVINTAQQGPEGVRGFTGYSAYQVWLNEGHTGTEADFFEFIRGATGATGPIGPIGLTGPVGPIGPDGIGLQFNWDTTQLGVKREDTADYVYADLKGSSLVFDDLTELQKEELRDGVVPIDANYTNTFLASLLT